MKQTQKQDNDLPSSYRPYVDWDEWIELPSRKERYARRTRKQKAIQIDNMREKTQPIDSNRLVNTSLTITNSPAIAEPKPISKPKRSLTKEQLRKRRLRLVKWIRLYRVVKRIIKCFITVVALILLAFWWKFVYVYDLPDYIQPQFPHMKGYIALKPWTFGPPILDVRSYGNPHKQIEIENFLIRLDLYKDVIENPFIIWGFKE